MTTDRTDGFRPEPAAAADPVDALLAATLGAEAVPSLSPGFEARLERRLALEGAGRPRIAGPWRWLLHLYWALAAGASLWILDRLDLPALGSRLGSVPWPALAALVLTAAGLALPFLALRRTGGSLLGLLRQAL